MPATSANKNNSLVRSIFSTERPASAGFLPVFAALKRGGAYLDLAFRCLGLSRANSRNDRTTGVSR